MPRLYALACLFTLIATVFVAPFSAQAAQTLVKPNDVNTGALLFETSTPGHYAAAPAVATDFDVTVTGSIIRTRVTQHFVNPINGWVEGIYVFPLPEDAAVDTLKMVVGDRIITGEIRERQEAKAIYTKAKAEGRKAALVEQLRPNMFTNSVANIGPGDIILVQIEYQANVHISDNRFSFRLPTVVAPRYRSPSEGASLQAVSGEPARSGKHRAAPPLPQPPVLDPRLADPVNPLTITVRIEAGFDIASLTSLHHPIVTKTQGSSQIVTLGEMAYADRDFELAWFAVANEVPKVGMFHEHVGEASYVLIQVTPPAQAITAPAPSREMIFVIDNSGSMSGPSMDQAKASLIEALESLTPRDTFNVVRFDDTMQTLFPHVVAGDDGNISIARRFAASLQARGGTEMLPALSAALKLDVNSNPSAVRQVVFLTDGAISNEQGLFNMIATRRGRSRIFMVGIGSAPNTFLMTRAAEIGRGTFTHIGSASEVRQRMAELTTKLTNPAITGLAATFSAHGVVATPDPLPDLYVGEPLSIFARMDTLDGSVSLNGLAGNNNWLTTLDLTTSRSGTGIARLWARRAIANAEVNRTLGTVNAEQADAAILKLALEHRIVSRLTSLVAVDTTPSRPDGSPLTRTDIPLNLPAGWDFDKVFGTKPQLREATAAGVISVAAQPALKRSQQLLALPQGSTPADLLMLIGLLLILIALTAAGMSRTRWAS